MANRLVHAGDLARDVSLLLQRSVSVDRDFDADRIVCWCGRVSWLDMRFVARRLEPWTLSTRQLLATMTCVIHRTVWSPMHVEQCPDCAAELDEYDWGVDDRGEIVAVWP